MKTTMDIQNLINKKADKRLEDDINSLFKVLNNGIGYQLTKDIQVNTGTVDKPNMRWVAYLLSSDCPLRKQIIENHQQKYRDEETKNFMDSVTSLRNDVDNLLYED
jgi:hypothetical protein